MGFTFNSIWGTANCWRDSEVKLRQRVLLALEAVGFESVWAERSRSHFSSKRPSIGLRICPSRARERARDGGHHGARDDGHDDLGWGTTR